MGKEMACTCRWNSKVSSGTAMLETNEILFRGDFRLVIRLKEIQSIAARDGTLRIDSSAGKADFDLGPQAEKWAHKILHPPARLDKLGVKAGMTVSLVSMNDTSFLDELKRAQANISEGKLTRQSDIIFFAAEAVADLKKLRIFPRAIKPAGAVWVIYPKGIKTITEADVRKSGLNAGLVDVKVARFSERETALKFVIPVARR